MGRLIHPCAWQVEGASTEADILAIEALYQRSFGDYLSVDLLVEYLQFLRDYDPVIAGGSAEGADKFRQATESAIASGGLHVAKGARLFEIYRDFEQSLADKPGFSAAAQTARVQELVLRQLSLPLEGNAALERRYLDGLGGQEPPEATAHAISKAREQLEQRRSYEAAIADGKPAGALYPPKHPAAREHTRNPSGPLLGIMQMPTCWPPICPTSS